MRVASAALCVLNEAACIREYLEALILLRPPLSVLKTPSAGMLLLRMLTVPSGFLYLHKDVEWLAGAIGKWCMFPQDGSGRKEEVEGNPTGKEQKELKEPGESVEEGETEAEKERENTLKRLQEQQANTNGINNGCSRYAKHMDEQFTNILMRDRGGNAGSRTAGGNRTGGNRTGGNSSSSGTQYNEELWNNPPVAIPVIAGGGTAKHDHNDSVWLNRNSLGSMVSGGESSGSELDWLIRLPWRIVVWSRDSMGWKEIPTDAHLALVTEPGPERKPGEGDGRDGGTIKYVIRAKALDDTGTTKTLLHRSFAPVLLHQSVASAIEANLSLSSFLLLLRSGKPCPFSMADPSTVLRCSLRLGDAHAVHSNGCLHSLGLNTEGGDPDADSKTLSLYSRAGVMGKYAMTKNPLDHHRQGSGSVGSGSISSGDVSSEDHEAAALKEAKQECYKVCLDPLDLNADAHEEFFWCSNAVRRACMKKEHQPMENYAGGMRVDGSVRRWCRCCGVFLWFAFVIYNGIE